MKTYLNSKQKIQTSFMAAMLAMMTEFDERGTLSKAERTQMKYSITYLTKLLKSMFARMPEVEKHVKHDLKDNRVKLVPKFEKLNEREYINANDLYDLLEMLVAQNCVSCERCDFKECAVFKMHQRLDIDIIDIEPDGVCPYGYMVREYDLSHSIS